MYLDTYNGFDGADMMEKFGFHLNSSAVFAVNKERWADAVGRSGDCILPNRPAEGDLLYFPLTKSVFEITKADVFNEFYQVGKLYNYNLTVELFKYSSEKFNTGNSDIDDIRFPFNVMDEETQKVLEGSNFTGENLDAQSDNRYMKNKNDNIIDFSTTNPFGDIVD
jgi:hypothetical protein